MEKQVLTSIDLEELAAAMTGSESEESEIIFEEFFNKYEIDENKFGELMTDLFDMLDLGVSPITNEVFIGFGTGSMWALKKAITSAFIGGLIQFLLEGDEYNDNGKGYSKIITKEDGTPDFNIIITRPDNKISITKPGEENVEQKKPEIVFLTIEDAGKILDFGDIQRHLDENTILHYVELNNYDTDEEGNDTNRIFQLSFSFYGKHFDVYVREKNFDNSWGSIELDGDSSLFESFEELMQEEHWELLVAICKAYIAYCDKLEEKE